jgi:hypothetical protein
MKRHTPGPWQALKGEANSDERGTWGSIVEPYGFYVAAIWSDCQQLADEAEANARLIAAAPDLLKALREILSYTPKRNGAAWQEARALVAQIDGQVAIQPERA